MGSNEEISPIEIKIIDDFMTQYAWTIYVLGYIAIADGVRKKAEREVIADFILTILANNSVRRDQLTNYVKEIGYASKTDFHRFIREKNPSESLKKLILTFSERIISTNIKAHTEQDRAMIYLKRKWNL